jgi:hypothetical protein
VNDETAPSQDSGIFGSLPSSRPGARSPRRTDGEKASSKPKRAVKAPPQARSKPKPPPEPPAQDRPAAAGEPEDGGQKGLEDLAWAGVAAAAEAATLGVRLATRALETVRRATDRQ